MNFLKFCENYNPAHLLLPACLLGRWEYVELKFYLLNFLFNLTCHKNQWTISSATTILEKCRKVVLEKWFCKLGFSFLVNHFSPTWKKVDLCYKTTFFSGQPLFSNQISRTTFLEPLFYTILEKWLQIKWLLE